MAVGVGGWNELGDGRLEGKIFVKKGRLQQVFCYRGDDETVEGDWIWRSRRKVSAYWLHRWKWPLI